MTIRLFTAFLIVLGLLPATASAAAPACPDDNADPLGGSGEVFGVGPRHVVAGVPQRAQAAGAIVVRDGNHTPRAGHAGERPRRRVGRAQHGRRTRRRAGRAEQQVPADSPGLDEDEYDTLLTGIPAGGILTLRGGYPALHGRLAAPGDAPGYGSVFALPS